MLTGEKEHNLDEDLINKLDEIAKELRLANELKKSEIGLEMVKLHQNNNAEVTNLNEIAKKLNNDISYVEKVLFGEIRNKIGEI